MSYSVAFHNTIQKYNVLQNPTTNVSHFFRAHPNAQKVALIANHLFRALAMAALCSVLPFALSTKIIVSFVASLFYRLTVETNCTYKFALPSFAGSLTFPFAAQGIACVADKVAFQSISSFALTGVYFIPFVAYITYVVLTVDYDVSH